MSQTDFTKENVEKCEFALKEIMESMPKKKAVEFIGHFNDLFLFLSGCKKIVKK